MTSFDYTYKKPDEKEYAEGLMAYLAANGETAIADLLRESKCTIQPSSTYSRSRGFVYQTSVYFQIRPDKLALITDEMRQKLVRFCEDAMPNEVGYEVVEVGFSPLLGKPSEARNESTKECRELWDLFICHATEDKDEIARPLADALSAKGLKVWYDEFTLTLGDSLSRSIDRGLADSKFGAVILSPSFFKKEWPQKELEGLRAKEIKYGKTILPVWHKVDRDYVLRYSPMLADRLAVSTSEGLDKVVDEILKAVSRSSAEQPRKGILPSRRVGSEQDKEKDPDIHFNVTQLQSNGEKRTFPSVGFNLQNRTGRQVRLRVVADVFLDGKYLGNPSADSGHYSGRRIWNLNANWGIKDGNFTVPVTHVEKGQRLMIRVSVAIIDEQDREHKLLPLGWIYIPENNDWYFEPAV